jgi:hypothetical protein
MLSSAHAQETVGSTAGKAVVKHVREHRALGSVSSQVADQFAFRDLHPEKLRVDLHVLHLLPQSACAARPTLHSTGKGKAPTWLNHVRAPWSRIFSGKELRKSCRLDPPRLAGQAAGGLPATSTL